MPVAFGLPIMHVYMPLKFIAVVTNLLGILMCYDDAEANVQASLRPGYRQSTHDDIAWSAANALIISLVCVLICFFGLFLGFTSLSTTLSFFQVALHGGSGALYLAVHFYSLHYYRFWHILFALVLPATLLEVCVVAHIRRSRKILW
eukprot:TRINITY_DN21014_c0_g1_i1.p2 TRINITY_DN21014_c0_g1~~TRINITY_DN21014_c0_g1_i1.p2  ORF type:complete len:147 (+),score=48.60 TRINITY_DN21014_c0_g1_i1:66-506(+)